jgi:zinc transport system substrate-binding protein
MICIYILEEDMYREHKTINKAKSLVSIALIFVIMVSVLTLSACSSGNNIDSSKLQITVSFNALREFAEAIGKDKVQVTTMIPDGTEPHSFDPKPKDLISMAKSKVFIYNGLGMEPWSISAIKSVGNKNLIVADASKGADSIKNTDENSIKNEGQYDPHLWLSLKGAEIEARNIKVAIEKADPVNKNYYEGNYNAFYARLESLYTSYKVKFNNLKNKDFVTGHAAFAYLARDFGLTQNSVEGIFAEGEPSALKLMEMVDYCKKNNIKTIFVENMVSPKVSQTLAEEVGAKAETIYTIESKDDNLNYIDSMSSNLAKIYDSLK